MQHAPLDTLKKSLTPLLEEYRIDILVVFGSTARGEQWQGSDLDIAFLAQERLTQYQMAQLICDVSRLSGVDHVHVIDLFFDPEIPAEVERSNRRKKSMTLLQYAIFSEGVPLYQRTPGQWDELRALAMDTAPWSGESHSYDILQIKIAYSAS